MIRCGTWMNRGVVGHIYDDRIVKTGLICLSLKCTSWTMTHEDCWSIRKGSGDVALAASTSIAIWMAHGIGAMNHSQGVLCPWTLQKFVLRWPSSWQGIHHHLHKSLVKFNILREWDPLKVIILSIWTSKSHVSLINTRLYFRRAISIKMRVCWARDSTHLGWVDLNEKIILSI